MPESTERKYHIWYEIIKADAPHFGKKEQLSVDPPLNHTEACTLLNKFANYSWRWLFLVEVA